MRVIRDVFTQARPIDRRIEKVIDYAATDEARLEQEISEYEVTASVERGLRRFIEAFDDGARLGTVTEIGVWVSGFYGSGKSSLTKYLGLALDSRRKIKGVPFVDRLADRIADRALGLHLKKVAKQHKAAIFMLDLGTDQLAESASDSVANVLYWNVLKELGFSKEKKVADLEIRLEQDQKLAAFEAAYEAHYPGREPWRVIHDDPMLAVTRASALVPAFYPDDFKTPADFRQLRYQPTEDVKELARRTIALVRRRTGCEAIVFFVDEVGQYVAPRRELILNLDGLVRAFKEAGQGKVWFVATAQQTLTEISERASLNSAELFKLKDRFPISLELLATDIREITAQRLLKKNADGEAELKRRYQASAELLELHTHLTDWQGGKGTLDADTFASLYPFLPSRLDLVLDLIRALARRTGGTGLRSAIRLVQDLLVDASRALPKGVEPLAERPLGRLATVEDVYDTLRQDIHKEHPQAVEGVDRIARHAGFKGDALALRVAKAVAALQPLENRPRTAENIAALLYADLGASGHTEAVRQALHRLVDAQEFGLVELRADGGAGGIGVNRLIVVGLCSLSPDFVPPKFG
ncbi:MAG: BREX system P-loop protein BrxC [Polyangiaceae bacterium]|nr:BREX system P-loop protein BrxC [Polyangiaceae bacterium]